MTSATRALEFEIFTLFPGAIESFVETGLLGRAMEHGRLGVWATNPRDFATDKHRSVDDTPFGGGAGMVMKPGPIVRAIEHVEGLRGPMHKILLTPAAPVFDQSAARRLAGLDRVGLLCGRYEGIDERVREHFVDECFSLGDFVLNGGEVAALAIVEAVGRLRDGVVGNPASLTEESFELGKEDRGPWLEHPHFTRPATFRGHEVPAVLTAGDHQAIERWRMAQSARRTWSLRPDLRPLPRLGAAHPMFVWSGSDLEGLRGCRRRLRKQGHADAVVLGLDDAPEALPVVAALDILPSPKPALLFVRTGAAIESRIDLRVSMPEAAREIRLAKGPALIDISQPLPRPERGADGERLAAALVREALYADGVLS